MSTSPHPDVPLFRRSIFTHLLGTTPETPDLVGGFPGTSPAYVDATTATVLTRATVRSLALQFAYSLHKLPAPLAHPSHCSASPTIFIFSPNNIVWPILLHGVAAAGFRVTLANSAYTASELAYQYTNSGARLIFAHPTLVPVVEDALESLGCTEFEIRSRVVVMTTQWLTGVADPGSIEAAHLLPLEGFFGRGALESEVNFDGERSNETLLLCYSSGTTGRPKGVKTTHYNLVSLIEIMRSGWPSTIPCLTPLLPWDASKASQTDVIFGTLPYYHIFGAVMLLMFPISRGTPMVVMGGFDPMRFCEAVERYRASMILVVPPMLVVLARHPAIDKYDMKSIRTVYSGAAPLGADLVATVRRRLEKVGANVIVSQAYGLTETTTGIMVLSPEDASTHIGSVGRVLPNLEVRLVREDAGEVLTDIEGAGELWVRGPTVMKGYWNNERATRAAITSDGWFKTGDIAVSDSDGFFTIIDRRKELIKYKGFQVAPAELEALLLQRPDVADAAVVGVYDKEEATELPRAYIVPALPVEPQGTAMLASQVQTWIAGRVAAHKKLRGGVVAVTQIPKSASGKILRRELRERAEGEVGYGQVVPRARL